MYTSIYHLRISSKRLHLSKLKLSIVLKKLIPSQTSLIIEGSANQLIPEIFQIFKCGNRICNFNCFAFPIHICSALYYWIFIRFGWCFLTMKTLCFFIFIILHVSFFWCCEFFNKFWNYLNCMWQKLHSNWLPIQSQSQWNKKNLLLFNWNSSVSGTCDTV